MKWISVKDRLPDEMGTCLVHNTYNKTFIARWMPAKKWYHYSKLEVLPQRKITHWMPLPAPPEV